MGFVVVAVVAWIWVNEDLQDGKNRVMEHHDVVLEQYKHLKKRNSK
jgi:hypothetical protein